MGSANVRGQLWGTGPHDWAEVVEKLVRLSCGNFGIVSRLEFALHPIPAILSGLRYQHIRPVR
jgi:hypothetical protein